MMEKKACGPRFIPYTQRWIACQSSVGICLDPVWSTDLIDLTPPVNLQRDKKRQAYASHSG